VTELEAAPLELADEAIVDTSDAPHDYEDAPVGVASESEALAGAEVIPDFPSPDEARELRQRAEEDTASEDDGTEEAVQGAPAHELPDDTRDGDIGQLEGEG
jgi:hypothetical protein